MCLLLIQGNKIARYEGRVQKEIFEIDWEEFQKYKDIYSIIEGIRIGDVK